MAGIARKFMRSISFSGSGSFNRSEIASLMQLVETRKELPDDTGSEDGITACGSFLEDLAKTAKILGVPSAPRDYRSSFTPNYRAIFPDETRNYRVDVLEGCLESPSAIWVNGDQFQLSPKTLTYADGLRTAWADVILMLDRWDSEASNDLLNGSSSQGPTKQDLCEVVETFDHAWANLEHKYIEELISIENRARSRIVEAIALEKKLSVLESQGLRPRALQRALEDVVESLGSLNEVSNHKRKGRNDLTADILVAARQAIDSPFAAAQVIAANVLKSFEALRVYLRKVEEYIESVDPHLGNNVGLVDRLVDWEETWEVGKRYLTSQPTFDTLCDLVDSIQRFQEVEPKLTNMLEECDVELFLILPRLVLLRYLVTPENQTDFLQKLIPERFIKDREGPAEAGAPAGRELQGLIANFTRARLAIGQAGSTCNSAWEFFARSALGSPNEAEKGAVHAFMHELESWSVEVQRHCAEDWNQCSAVVVQCLSRSVQDSKNRSEPDVFDV